MSRLADQYQPQNLAEIVGQPVIRHLQTWAANPDSRCFLLEGDGGVGKSSAAYCLAVAIGCDPSDPCSGYYREDGATFTIEKAQDYFSNATNGRQAYMRLCPMIGQWNVLIIEEMEWLSPQCLRYLKDALDVYRRPKRAVVIATSNDASKFPGPFRQRFDIYRFSSGETFASACVDRLTEIWRIETGLPELPAGWKCWGWDGENFSMREALNDMGRAISGMRREVAA